MYPDEGRNTAVCQLTLHMTTPEKICEAGKDFAP